MSQHVAAQDVNFYCECLLVCYVMSCHVAVQDVAFIVSAFKAAMLCHVM